MAEIETLDLLIIGAGWHGLAIAKTYIEAQVGRGCKVMIMDNAESVGGTWAKERLYPGLNTNNVVGSFEFSDFPMERTRYSLKPGDHIPGEVVHRYLCDFAAHFNLSKFIQLRTKVEAVSLRDDDTWEVNYCVHPSGYGQTETHQLISHKLVIATGMTSQPFIPLFPGREEFCGHLFHVKDLHTFSRSIATNDNVVVIGGNKSAWDACYLAANAGAKVHMVIRPSGGGPSWVWKPWHLAFMKMTLARLSSTRLFVLFDPNPFAIVFSSVHRILHQSLLGRWITMAFWAVLGFCVELATGYRDPKLKVLRPWTSIFWMGNSVGIHNYDSDWFELVRSGKIEVHHAEVESLGKTTVNLSGGRSLQAEVVVCCTGWDCAPSVTIKSSPRDVDHDVLSHKRESAHTTRARNHLIQTFPMLRNPPIRRIPGLSSQRNRLENNQHPSMTGLSPRATGQVSYKLYRFLIPPDPRFLRMRNLAFIGAHRSVHAIVVAQCQALWITAFFQGRIPDLTEEKVRKETTLHAEYERLRRPRESGGHGDRFPDLVFDSIPYADLLLGDLGLRMKRKSTAWANLVEPHTPRDYQGLTEEYLEHWSEGSEEYCHAN